MKTALFILLGMALCTFTAVVEVAVIFGLVHQLGFWETVGVVAVYKIVTGIYNAWRK